LGEWSGRAEPCCGHGLASATTLTTANPHFAQVRRSARRFLGKIDTWKERIILDPIDFDEPLALLDPDEENPPDIDVPIERLT
jgi:hypothetical protein